MLPINEIVYVFVKTDGSSRTSVNNYFKGCILKT